MQERAVLFILASEKYRFPAFDSERERFKVHPSKSREILPAMNFTSFLALDGNKPERWSVAVIYHTSGTVDGLKHRGCFRDLIAIFTLNHKRKNGLTSHLICDISV